MPCKDEVSCLLSVVLQKKKKKDSLMVKLGKCKLLAEALHMTVSQSVLDDLSKSSSDIENGELHVLISCNYMVRFCSAPVKLMRALPWAPL